MKQVEWQSIPVADFYSFKFHWFNPKVNIEQISCCSFVWHHAKMLSKDLFVLPRKATVDFWNT